MINCFPLLLLCCFLSFDSIAQNQYFLLPSIGQSKAYRPNPTQIATKAPIVGIHFRVHHPNGNYQQFSVGDFWLVNREFSTIFIEEFQIAGQYTFGARTWKITDKLTLFLGGQAGIRFYKQEQRNFENSPNKAENSYLSLYASGWIDVQFALSERLSLNLLTTLSGLQLGMEAKKTQISGNTSIDRYLDLTGNDPIGVHLGLGFRLGK